MEVGVFQRARNYQDNDRSNESEFYQTLNLGPMAVSVYSIMGLLEARNPKPWSLYNEP